MVRASTNKRVNSCSWFCVVHATYNPVPFVESSDHGRAECTRSVHGGTGVDNAPEVARKQGQANANLGAKGSAYLDQSSSVKKGTNRCKRCAPVLFSCQHQHCQDQLQP
jgi:hypothetical protein